MRCQTRGARTYRRLAAGAVFGALLSCDPHSASAPVGGTAPQPRETKALFANAATSATAIIRGDLDFAQFGLWSQQLASIDGSPTDRYALDSASVDATWNALYYGPLQDIEQALRQAITENDPHEVAPLLVLRAWTYFYVTGMWGDVPFSAANRGDEGMIAPSYDEQSVIYDALLKDLTQAPQLMSAPGSGGFASSDPIYAGDAAKWRRFASSLRARLGLDLLKADATRAKSEVIAAIAAGGFTSNDDDAVIRWPGDGTNDNPWSRHVRARDDLRLSKSLVDTLSSLTDPRLAVYGQLSTLGGQYAGAPNGLSADLAAPYAGAASAIGTAVLRKDAPSVLMSFAEFSFIEAEAAERGWIAGSAKQFYEQGIRASLSHWGIGASEIDAYLAQSSVQYAGGTVGLGQIAVQKWIALFAEGLDAWSEWRRTASPDLVPVTTASTSPPSIPRRVFYPRSETTLNAGNIQAAITAQGGAGLTDHLWIDR